MQEKFDVYSKIKTLSKTPLGSLIFDSEDGSLKGEVVWLEDQIEKHYRKKALGVIIEYYTLHSQCDDFSVSHQEKFRIAMQKISETYSIVPQRA